MAIFRAKDFQEALEVANHTAYALTGGVYSRSPANISLACQAFDVGNLYINRSITGSLVGRQPFGGHRPDRKFLLARFDLPGYFQGPVIITVLLLFRDQ